MTSTISNEEQDTVLNDQIAAQTKMKAIMDAASNTAIYTITLDGVIESWNSGSSNIFGYSESEAIGMNFSRFYSKADLDNRVPQGEIRDAIAKGTLNFEGWRLAKGDKKFYAQASLSPLKDASGAVVGLVKVVIDITARKAAEERSEEQRLEQQQAQAYMRSILEAASNTAIYTISTDGVIQTWNSGSAKIFGFSESEAKGMDFRKFYQQSDLDNRVPDGEIRDAIVQGTLNFEGWRLSKGNKPFYAQASLSPLKDESGKVTGLVKVVVDVTDRRLAEERMEKQRKEMRAILEAASNTAIYTISPEGIIQTWNSGSANIFGYTEAEAIGMDFRRFYGKEELERNGPEGEIRDSISKGSLNFEGWRIAKGNQKFYAQASLSPLKDDNGKVVGLVKVVADITERQLGKEKIESQRQEMIEIINVLNGSTAEISSVASQLSSSTAQATAAISQTTATAEEVKQTADQTSHQAKTVSADARAVVVVSRQGQDATDATIKGMVRIREQMESIADCMVQLSNQSKLIGDIIATVDDLAQQSNLLAVNASIEAAKAGEQGKGFAVVAQEVKNLSQQSKSATAHVRSILNDIVKATSAATMATEQGSKAVEVGHEQASEAGKVIKTLSASIEKAALATEVIEVSSQQQLIGMQQMVEAMEGIKLASEQNLAAASQLEDSGKGLSDLGLKLQLISAN